MGQGAPPPTRGRHLSLRRRRWFPVESKSRTSFCPAPRLLELSERIGTSERTSGIAERQPDPGGGGGGGGFGPTPASGPRRPRQTLLPEPSLPAAGNPEGRLAQSGTDPRWLWLRDGVPPLSLVRSSSHQPVTSLRRCESATAEDELRPPSFPFPQESEFQDRSASNKRHRFKRSMCLRLSESSVNLSLEGAGSHSPPRSAEMPGGSERLPDSDPQRRVHAGAGVLRRTSAVAARSEEDDMAAPVPQVRFSLPPQINKY